MNMFWRWYDWSERTFWNSLTKKLMSFLVLAVIDIAYLVVYLRHSTRISAELHLAGSSAEVIERVDAVLHQGLMMMVSLTVVAIALNLLQIAYIRHLILRPIRLITNVFDEVARGEGDFSRNLPTISHDELRHMAESYNRFADRMRELIHEVRQKSVNISREAVVVKATIASTTRRAQQQGEIAESVLGASAETTAAIRHVSSAAERIAGATDSNLETARNSLDEMNGIVREVESVSGRLASFNDTVADLGRRSDSIRDIATLIKDIADQTNLLALNAAIEAARAGEQGRGFAVVADEVRKLAERVNLATQEITQNIGGMAGLVENTLAENSRINGDIQRTRDVVANSAQDFRKMVSDFEDTGRQLTSIAQAMDELNSTNANVHEAIERLQALSAEVSGSMQSSGQASATLAEATETVQAVVARFKIGRGAFDHNVEGARQFRDAVQEALASLQGSGIDIWDQNYRPVPGTDPQKYEVGYLRAAEQKVQPILDDFLARLQGGLYTLIIDAKGYGPIHNLKFSKPLTGDYQTDLVGNRTKRIWTDPTGQRAARNTQALLVQTYARDTGEILSEINMPINVGGRIWGNVRAGIDSSALVSA